MDSKGLKFLISTCKELDVLYVEDDYEVRSQISKMLSIYFKSVIEAVDGKDGLDRFNNSKFDVIFTDINMSVMDGISMIKEIRKKDLQIPIVIFSAYDNTEYFLKTIECGIDGYILKPFSFEEIKNVIEKVVFKLTELKESDRKIELINGFHWDKVNTNLYKDDKEIQLTKKEKILFELLASSKHRVVSSEDIEIVIFDDDYSDNKRVRSLLSRLRCRVGCDLMHSIYSQGYKLNLRQTC